MCRALTKLGLHLGSCGEADQLFASAACVGRGILGTLSVTQCVDLLEAFARFLNTGANPPTQVPEVFVHFVEALLSTSLRKVGELDLLSACHCVAVMAVLSERLTASREHYVSALAYVALQLNPERFSALGQQQLAVMCGLPPYDMEVTRLRSALTAVALKRPEAHCMAVLAGAKWQTDGGDANLVVTDAGRANWQGEEHPGSDTSRRDPGAATSSGEEPECDFAAELVARMGKAAQQAMQNSAKGVIPPPPTHLAHLDHVTPMRPPAPSAQPEAERLVAGAAPGSFKAGIMPEDYGSSQTDWRVGVAANYRSVGSVASDYQSHDSPAEDEEGESVPVRRMTYDEAAGFLLGAVRHLPTKPRVSVEQIKPAGLPTDKEASQPAPAYVAPERKLTAQSTAGSNYSTSEMSQLGRLDPCNFTTDDLWEDEPTAGLGEEALSSRNYLFPGQDQVSHPLRPIPECGWHNDAGARSAAPSSEGQHFVVKNTFIEAADDDNEMPSIQSMTALFRSEPRMTSRHLNFKSEEVESGGRGQVGSNEAMKLVLRACRRKPANPPQAVAEALLDPPLEADEEQGAVGDEDAPSSSGQCSRSQVCFDWDGSSVHSGNDHESSLAPTGALASESASSPWLLPAGQAAAALFRSEPRLPPGRFFKSEGPAVATESRYTSQEAMKKLKSAMGVRLARPPDAPAGPWPLGPTAAARPMRLDEPAYIVDGGFSGSPVKAVTVDAGEGYVRLPSEIFWSV